MKWFLRLSELLRSENGDAVVEYALLIAFISIVLVAGAVALTDGVNNIFTNIGTALTNVVVNP
jgi:Flp pilus assembly pilin Flp